LKHTWQNIAARALSHVLAIGAVALVLVVTFVPAHAQTLVASVSPVMPLPVPANVAALRAQPAKGATLVPLAPGEQALTPELLANYVERQKILRSTDVFAILPQPELTEDALMGYIARSTIGPNSAVSAIASFTTPSVNEEPALNVAALSAYIETGFEPLEKRLARANAERDCLTQAIYHEARGESEVGQLAVANVIVNRARSGKFPSTLCGVIYQNADKGLYRCQFTFACDGREEVTRERRALARSAALAQRVYRDFAKGEAVGAVPGSTLYYHTKAVNPSWAGTYNAVAEIGSHVFYSPN
jgi:hypothetical protein